jgi:hypothetical protein
MGFTHVTARRATLGQQQLTVIEKGIETLTFGTNQKTVQLTLSQLGTVIKRMK